MPVKKLKRRYVSPTKRARLHAHAGRLYKLISACKAQLAGYESSLRRVLKELK